MSVDPRTVMESDDDLEAKEESKVEKGRQAYCQKLTDGLREAWLAERFTDLTVVVGERTFRCHKNLMSALSLYFKAMLTSDMVEGREGVVRLQGVDSATFQHVLAFVYSAQDDVPLTEQSALDLLVAADRLQMRSLKEWCTELLGDKLSEETCIRYWLAALTFNSPGLEALSRQHVLRHFPSLARGQELLELQTRDLASLLQDDALAVTREEQVFELVCKWVERDPDVRLGQLDDVMKHVRFPLMNAKFLMRDVMSQEFMGQPAYKAMVDYALRYHMLPEERHLMTSTSVLTRMLNVETSVLLVLYADVTVERERILHGDFDLYAFRLNNNKWYHIFNDFVFSPFSALCPYGTGFFLSGGMRDWQKLFWFDLATDVLAPAEKQEMPQGRHSHGLVGVGGSLYALGGKAVPGDLNYLGVDRYDVTRNVWEAAGFLQAPATMDLSTVVHRDHVIVIATHVEGSKASLIMQTFNVLTGSCAILDVSRLPPEVQCGRVAVCATEERIFLLTSCGQILELTSPLGPEAGPTLARLPDFKYRHAGFAQSGGNLYVFGGVCVPDGKFHNAMFRFNPETRTLIRMSTALHVFYIRGVFLTNINKDHIFM